MKQIKKFFLTPLGKVFLAAAFLRLLLAPFFFHTDIKTNYYNGHFLSEGVINIYDFLAKNPQKATLGEFSYPFLTYLFYGLLYLPWKLLLGMGFPQWLGMGNEAVAVPNLFRYLFFMKLPLFVFEFLTGWLIVKIIDEEKKKKIALMIWFFNPVNLYAIVLMGQFDIVPVFLTVLSLYWAINKKNNYAALALGLGGAFKSFPLLFLPYLVIAGENSWFKRIKLALFGLLPYLAVTLPFIGSKAFRQSSLVSGLSQRIFFLGLPIGFQEQVLLVIFSLILLFFIEDWFVGGDWVEIKAKNLVAYFLTTTLILLAGSHFHPQWLLWSMPFLTLFLAKQKRLFFPSIVLCFSWLGIIFLFKDKFLTLGLFSPFDPGLFFLPCLAEMIKEPAQLEMITNVLHTIFAAAAVWLSYLVVSEKYAERK